jgi:hypothetical protein
MSAPLPAGDAPAMPSLQKEIVMKTLAAVAACMFGFTGVCHAAQIASPAIYGALSQTGALCIVYNAGSTPQAVQVQFFDEEGTVLDASGNCKFPTVITGTVGGGFCQMAIAGPQVASNKAYACVARANNVTNLRGSIIMQGSPGPVPAGISLRSAPLR